LFSCFLAMRKRFSLFVPIGVTLLVLWMYDGSQSLAHNVVIAQASLFLIPAAGFLYRDDPPASLLAVMREAPPVACWMLGAGVCELSPQAWDVDVRGRHGAVPVRCWGSPHRNVGLVVHVHGGGLHGGSFIAEQHVSQYLSVAANVCSVGYRLAPEHKDPVAVDDVEDAVRVLWPSAADVRGKPRRLVLFGISAGGYLAARVALRLASTETLLVMVAPMVSPTFFGPSQHQYARAVWGHQQNAWSWRWFLGESAETGHVDLLRAAEDGEKFPLTYVAVATRDYLRDQGVALAVSLNRTKQLVALKEWDTSHLGCKVRGFWDQCLGGARDRMIDFLRAAGT